LNLDKFKDQRFEIENLFEDLKDESDGLKIVFKKLEKMNIDPNKIVSNIKNYGSKKFLKKY
jgi:hypothetical protein